MPRDLQGAARMFLVAVLVAVVLGVASNLDAFHGWARAAVTALTVLALYAAASLLIQEGRARERRSKT